ncbi:XDD4 family exosortase-dependent surface protein [Pantanalinema rosaneae CENA516]|uniref:XDD4 family exosortase-dependent surface protein n=1 Tax=Pantanalinema rosaneae TaxID=1620701 RepID=UPI003D6F31AC
MGTSDHENTLLKSAAIVGTITIAGTLSPAPAQSASVFTGSSGALSASVSFDISGSNLLVQLTNTGSGANVPADILTAVFWDIAENPSLSLSSANAPTVTQNNPNTSSTNVNLLNTPGNGQEWSFAQNSSGLPGVSQRYGLGTAGLNIFQGIGGQQQFQYGIVNGYGNSANNPVQQAPLVNNVANFVLAGLPNNFNLADISNVRFQYGTNLNEPNFPGTSVPTPALLPGLLALGAGVLRKRKAEQAAEAETEV